MEVTALLINFNNYLKGSWPFLIQSNIDRGVDDWDNWVELSYKVFVLNRLHEEYNRLVDLDYGVWIPESGKKTIFVKILNEPKLFFSKENHNYKEIKIDYFEDISLSFREFNHPFKNDNDIAAFNYVLGEVVSSTIHFNKGDIICVELKYCEFYL